MLDEAEHRRLWQPASDACEVANGQLRRRGKGRRRRRPWRCRRGVLGEGWGLEGFEARVWRCLALHWGNLARGNLVQARNGVASTAPV